MLNSLSDSSFTTRHGIGCNRRANRKVGRHGEPVEMFRGGAGSRAGADGGIDSTGRLPRVAARQGPCRVRAAGRSGRDRGARPSNQPAARRQPAGARPARRWTDRDGGERWRRLRPAHPRSSARPRPAGNGRARGPGTTHLRRVDLPALPSPQNAQPRHGAGDQQMADIVREAGGENIPRCLEPGGDGKLLCQQASQQRVPPQSAANLFAELRPSAQEIGAGDEPQERQTFAATEPGHGLADRFGGGAAASGASEIGSHPTPTFDAPLAYKGSNDAPG